MKFVKVILFLLCCLTFTIAQAQSSAELKRRREKLNDELEQLNRQYEETAKNKKATQRQLALLKAQINLRSDKIKAINSEVRVLDNQISENSHTVHTLQEQLEQLKKEYAAMVLFAYHNKSAHNKLMFVFAAGNFNQAYKRLKYLQQFGDYRKRQANTIENTQTELHQKINQLDKTKKEKNTLLKDQEKEKANLGKEKDEELQVIVGLSRQQGQLKKERQEKQRNIQRLNSMIASAIRREIEEARRRAIEEERRRAAAEAARAKAEGRDAAPVAKRITSSSTTSEVLNATPEAAKLSNDFLGNKGRLPWPVANGGVIQGFGFYTQNGIRSESSGLTIRTSEGGSVRAVFDGSVHMVSNVGGSYVIIVKHGEYFTVYNNLRSVSVSKGQKVNTKQTLGTAGVDPSTGLTTAEFQLWKGTTAVNPSAWLTPN